MAQCIIAVLKKAVYDGGWEATSILVLKRNIEEKARQIFLLTIFCLFNTVKEQLAVCAQDDYWAVHRLALNHHPLGTNLPRNIHESTHFCL